MKCRFSAVIDTDIGSYEVELNNLEEPGEGLEYEVLRQAVYAVLADLDRRMQDVQSGASGSDAPDYIEVHGDDPVH